MSYMTISQSANDPALRARITAACAQEGNVDATMDVLWPVCVAADRGGGLRGPRWPEGNPNPGGDETVITDGMILCLHVQATTCPHERLRRRRPGGRLRRHGSRGGTPPDHSGAAIASRPRADDRRRAVRLPRSRLLLLRLVGELE